MSPSFQQLDEYRIEIPATGNMRVPGIVYARIDMLEKGDGEQALQQVRNVACLPGILKASLAMPDMHWGYGFPIGGVAAFDWDTGVVSPGGVGYDINCGVRLCTTAIRAAEIRPKLQQIVDALYRDIPCGVGSTGSIRLSNRDRKAVLEQGSRWAQRHGMAEPEDIEHTEDGGCMAGAHPEDVSDRAMERGKDQLGTLGAGNHFLEIGVVDRIFDPNTADAFGLVEGGMTLMLHSGSRGLGYQVCDDYLAMMIRASAKYGISLPDRQLACAPLVSEEARRYLSAMACAANYAWANRQILMHLARESLMRVLAISPKGLGFRLLYDVCHNIAKKEVHVLDGKLRTVCVHRKGATRAFAPGSDLLPEAYRKTGQPVIVPGDMGRESYVLVGTEKAMTDTFGSTCHGAGRLLSRSAAQKASKGRSIDRELAQKGVLVRWTGRSTLAEEMPEAYKHVSDVVDVVDGAGISRKVARLRPLGVIKG
ncbi:RtcB family protein [Desulfatirhabdium butyrativorans]|uniref:RtcB family protein n=1 Tax=Desulfatirhabdium butyrativorans TaxID=340467 RepID=UPI0004161BC4|nr:RtcB family protein [Desulfatirhabdium butyrativorans]